MSLRPNAGRGTNKPGGRGHPSPAGPPTIAPPTRPIHNPPHPNPAARPSDNPSRPVATIRPARIRLGITGRDSRHNSPPQVVRNYVVVPPYGYGYYNPYLDPYWWLYNYYPAYYTPSGTWITPVRRGVGCL